MLQVKILKGKDIETLNDAVNVFLANFNEDAIKDINVEAEKMVAVIQYTVKPEWTNKLCADCKYWDDAGCSDAVSGLCQERGGRRRFNCKACECFKDIRG